MLMGSWQGSQAVTQQVPLADCGSLRQHHFSQVSLKQAVDLSNLVCMAADTLPTVMNADGVIS